MGIIVTLLPAVVLSTQRISFCKTLVLVASHMPVLIPGGFPRHYCTTENKFNGSVAAGKDS